MPALKDKAISLLGSLAVLSTAGSPPVTIFTTPPGKVTYITHIVVRDPTASMAAGGATDIKFGTGFRNNVGVDLQTLTTANTDYIVLMNQAAAGTAVKCTEIAASTAFVVTFTTGTTAACTATYDVFGYTK